MLNSRVISNPLLITSVPSSTTQDKTFNSYSVSESLSPVSEVQMPEFIPLAVKVEEPAQNSELTGDDDRIYCSPEEINFPYPAPPCDLSLKSGQIDSDHNLPISNVDTGIETPADNLHIDNELTADNLYIDNELPMAIAQIEPPTVVVQIEEQNSNKSDSDSEWDSMSSSSDSDPVYSDLPTVIAEPKTRHKITSNTKNEEIGLNLLTVERQFSRPRKGQLDVQKGHKKRLVLTCGFNLIMHES